MNDELRSIFTEQIANNIEQAKEEMGYDKINQSEGIHHEQESTAIDNTPPTRVYDPPQHSNHQYDNMPSSNFRSIDYSQQEMSNSNGYTIHHSERQHSTIDHEDRTHTYPSPGPILINPHNNEKRTLPKKLGNKKPRGTQSCISMGVESHRPNRPHINSHSVLLANKKKFQNEPAYRRLHSDALNKQKRSKKTNVLGTGSSYEANSVMNNSFSGMRSTQRQGRTLFESAKTVRNRTPNNYGEKLYQKGLQRIEEKKRKNHKELLEKEMKEYEKLTFRPEINPVSRYFGRYKK